MNAPFIRTFAICLTVFTFLAGLRAAEDEPSFSATETRRLNRRLLRLEPNRWEKIHTQQKTDKVQFLRQGHGGGCFDSKRGVVILFGSNTHGKDWKNSPFFFDPVENEWTQAYPDDPFETYAVNEEGIPVAGKDGDRPWAMHTFGAVEYDPQRDEMIVSIFDDHMKPGRFTNVTAELWPKIKKRPTWVFQRGENKWTPLPCEGVSFFPCCTTFDTDRGVVVGYGLNGIWELGGEPRRWTKTVEKPLVGWHNNAAYDSRHKAIIVFGTHQNGNDVIVYRPENKEHKKMPTPGERPPKDQHAPMAFEPEVGRTTVLVDRVKGEGKNAEGATETWLYDLGADAWTRIPTAELPFTCGMNYNLYYDCGHKVLLLVTGDYGRPTVVWALKLKLDANAEPPKTENGGAQ
jgi:hypothetical protein